MRIRLTVAAWGVLGFLGFGVAAAQTADEARWHAEAARVTIVRDDWGIAHVHGKSDADAVFGMIYAQCEDDFNRVEMNYLTALGRTAEAEGESAIWQDLRQRLFIDPDELKKDYAESPEWLKKLMDAWADGINFYLATHKEVKPKVLTRFEQWMALSFTEGSIGGDIERVDLKKLEALEEKQIYEILAPPGISSTSTKLPVLETDPMPHSGDSTKETSEDGEPRGSNGIAISPRNTVDHHALLLINPHTSFFFRSELQITSDEGLNAYGAVTWGQFFIYQGFNDRAGWMHTSSGVDAVDEFIETVEPHDGQMASVYGKQTIRIQNKRIAITYRTPAGPAVRSFDTVYTEHGPVVRAENGHFIAIELMNIPIKALEQSYLRTKARTYAEYKKTMELEANSSNNTLFADADGDIAYWHGNFIPLRDTKFDYTKPVDGSDPATDWKGLMTLDQVPHLLNPASGYLFNVNDSPWNGAGASSLKKADYPAYVEQGIESARGVHAMRVLAPDGKPKTDFTLEGLRAAAFDSYLPWFARTLPLLVKAWDEFPKGTNFDRLKEQIDLLRNWDYRWSSDSVATTVAVYWGTELLRQVGADARQAHVPSEQYVATHCDVGQLLATFFAGLSKLQADFGKWQVPWGDVNRFQRLNDDIVAQFTDAGASIPVPFPSALWGSLASFGARQYPGTKKWYGTSGNSFVAVVEFGPKVKAIAVTAGGESGHPGSKHFDDEAERYALGNLREVYFYPEQLLGHTERTYRPGD
jgi:acyl-homoserine lactone acylase PvdQ